MSFVREDQLLILCSRVCLDEATKKNASALLSQELDWDYVLESSIQHAVAPLFYHGLKQIWQGTPPNSYLPESVACELRELYQGNQARNRRLYRVVGEIARTFGKAGIDVLGLKDLQLARVVYPDPALRPIGDIDLLIHREQYPQVAACMAELGFSPLPSVDIPYTLKYAWAHHFRRSDDNVWVDMQWNVLQIEWDVYHDGNFDFEIQRMWRGATSLAIDDYRILVPRPEDMLFHLCMHLQGHRYCELILFCDIAELLRHYRHEIAWDYLVSITNKYGANSSVYYALSLVQQLFGSSVPEYVLEQLVPAFFKANLFAPLFGNLTSLHLALDDIRSSASPPPTLMHTVEAETRRQTMAAQQVYRELDGLAGAFAHAGGRLLIFSGMPSEKVFPDDALEAFGTLQVCIIEEDLPLMFRVLQQRQFQVCRSGDTCTIRKHWQTRSADPVFGGQPIPLHLNGTMQSDLDGLLRAGSVPTPSKREAALKLLKTKLVQGKRTPSEIGADFRIIALSPEDLLLYLGARLGRQSRDRLFGLCTLLEFFRIHRASLDWDEIERGADAHGIAQDVRRGLSMVADLCSVRLPATMLLPDALKPRVLESARYDPEQNYRYTAFKEGFFFWFTLLSLEGAAAKTKYLLASIKREWSHPLLSNFAVELLKSMVSKFDRQPVNGRRFAYWLESGWQHDRVNRRPATLKKPPYE